MMDWRVGGAFDGPLTTGNGAFMVFRKVSFIKKESFS